MLATRAADNVAMVAFCNLVGGQDELVFDGGSVIFDERGELIARGKQFEEDLVIADLNVESVFRERLHDPRRRREKLLSQADGDLVRRIELSRTESRREKPPLPQRKVERLGRLPEIYRALVLGTGNKSELAVGCCTLYGDMAGGFAVIKDVPKSLVYELARYRSSLGEVIPQAVFDKAPSAELRPNRRDEDSLGPYAVLDPILQAYVEEDRSLAEIMALGFDEEAVRRIIRMMDGAEYKRRQAPPGVKITPRAFGKDRRLPITNEYRQ